MLQISHVTNVSAPKVGLLFSFIAQTSVTRGAGHQCWFRFWRIPCLYKTNRHYVAGSDTGSGHANGVESISTYRITPRMNRWLSHSSNVDMDNAYWLTPGHTLQCVRVPRAVLGRADRWGEQYEHPEHMCYPSAASHYVVINADRISLLVIPTPFEGTL